MFASKERICELEENSVGNTQHKAQRKKEKRIKNTGKVISLYKIMVKSLTHVISITNGTKRMR